MNYYPHHIGDFNNATRHLTRVERSLYRDLIDLYYDTEQPIQATDFNALCKKVLAYTDDEKKAVLLVLNEFFEREGDVWRHIRCDKEIAFYKYKQESAVKAGKASAAQRLLNASSTVVQPTRTRTRTRTKNQEPVKSRVESRASRFDLDSPPPDWIIFAEKERPDLTATDVFARFRDYWLAKAGKDGRKVDWFATWRNWVRNEKQFGSNHATSGRVNTSYVSKAEQRQRANRQAIADFLAGDEGGSGESHGCADDVLPRLGSNTGHGGNLARSFERLDAGTAQERNQVVLPSDP